MQKQRLIAIEYIRGISMLGVIGIHTGSQYLSNPSANIHLVAFFEIFTRFSVPIFFFISAFGLFYHLNLREKFNYAGFIQRRFKTVLVPYLAWSGLYLLHYALVYHDFSLFSWNYLPKFLFFGLASYQLYFLVIMLWFYLLMPLWISVIRRCTPRMLCVLLILQLSFDYWSSYMLSAASISSPYLKPFIEYRLNYWVFHYFFIFILGGYAAAHYETFSVMIKQHYKKITVFFWFSLCGILTHYYYLIYMRHYSAESAINTAHQLSPAGIFYTIGASLFFFALFSQRNLPQTAATLLSLLGRHSYFAYLFHPFAIFYLAILTGKFGLLMTAPVSLIFYASTAVISVFAAILLRKAGSVFPLINILLIGVYPRK